MKGWLNNRYQEDLVYGVFEDGELVGAFCTEEEAQRYIELQEQEPNTHEYEIIYRE